MALILRKNIKLVNLVRLLSCYSSNQNCRTRYTNIAASRSIQYKLYATAAHNYKVNLGGFDNNNKVADLIVANEGDIDKLLHDIDLAVKRTGRTILDTVHSAYQIIENVGFATENQSLYLIRCCGLLLFESPSKRVELVNKIWDKFKTLGLKLDTRHFNALLKVYLDCNKSFSPSNILISMEHLNIEPNQETYSCLIEKYCRDGNLNGANEILEYLKEKNIPVNEGVFNSLIKGHMKIDDVEGAKDIIEVMRNSNISPSSRTYSTLACSFADKGDLNELEKVLIEADSLGIYFGNNHYLQILIAAAPVGNDKFVNKILQKMSDIYSWRQDFINAAAVLIHKGFDNIAHRLIMEVSSKEYSTATNNFLKVLIKAECPMERVIRYCNEIFEKGYNNYIFLNGSKISIEYGNVEHAIGFFNEMKKHGIPVRIRDFRPLIIGNKHSVEGIWKIMKTMAELGIPLDYLTYREHILSAIGNIEPRELISKIDESGHSISCVIDPLFEHYCDQGEINNALYIIENHSVKVNMYFKLVHFLSHYNKFARNPAAYFKVLKYIMESAGLPGQDVNSVRGNLLAVFLRTNPKVFEAFHKSETGKDCIYHGRSVEICKRNIRMNAPNLSKYLRYIDSDRNKAMSKPLQDISLEEEEELISTASDFSKQNTIAKLFSHHIKNHDIERINCLKSKLDNQEFILPPTLYAQMFFLECEMGSLDAAKKSFQKIKELYPTFKIATPRLFDYARLLLKYSNFDEAVAIIENECQEVTDFSESELLIRGVRRFLNNIVQTGNVDLAKSVQSSLINRTGFSELKEIILEPIIKIYLYQGDLENSLNEYENCIVNYQCSPCQNMFIKKLILADDSHKLQTVVDLASKIEGNSKTLHKLGLAFLDLERLQQATKVFQKLGRDINFKFLEETGKRYLTENKITVLENLVHATSSLKYGGKEKLYNLLLSNYCKQKQYEKCSKILNLMKADNIEPNNEYKQLINDLCAFHKKPLHFPGFPENNTSDDLNDSTLSGSETAPFLNFVLQGDGKEALKELNALKKGYIRTIPLKDMSSFIELLVKDNCLNDLAINNNQIMSFIIDNASEIFKPLLEKYSEEGKVEAMVSLASVFPDFSLRKGFFNSFLARAYFKNNRHEELLSELEARSQKKNKLFSVVAFQELVKIPHLESRTVKLAKSYINDNFDYPLAVVWAHFFSSEQYEKADELSQVAPIPLDKIDAVIFRHLQETENVELGKKYVEFVSRSEYKDRVKERAYGILLDLLVVKQMHEDAVNLIMDAKSKRVDLEKHYQSTLTTLKSSLERENKPVPFNVLS